ncbi:hypothetical protein [Leuconostoc gasicomitatum]|nr:hypothetical protein [Leuconostoc gasicomitatum]CUW14204.1 hypothetical protein PB1E_0583 [Leuconostoc gasicomitatum]
MHYGYLKVDQTYMYFDEKDGHAVQVNVTMVVAKNMILVGTAI